MNSEGDDYEGTAHGGGHEMEGGLMPPPWERHLSEDDEQFYYYNPETGECLWETDLLEFLADDEFQNSNDDDVHGSGEYSNGEDVGREAVDYDDYDDGHVEPRDERYDPIDDEDAPPPPPPDEDIDGLDLMALANMNVAGSQASTSVYDGISDSSLSVVERSKLTMRAKQQKINSFQQSREREQLRAQTAIPVTTRKAQSMQRSVEDMLQWEEERRQRLHRTKATLRAQEDAEVTGRPMLTKKAEEVSKRWREGGHGDDGQSLAADGQASVVSSARSVQDRLYEYDERKKEKIERIQAERDAAIRSSAIPRINPMSNKILERKGGSYYGGEAASVAGTSLGGESHVSERLYALAQLKQQQQSESMPSDAMGPGSFLAQGRLTQHDPSTGQRYFEPRLNPVSEAIATRRRQQLRHLKIEDVLHAQGEQYRQKLAEKGQRRWLQEEQKRKTSKVNALSAKIVEDKYIVSGETTQDRLARGIGTVRRRVLDTIDQPTFQPKISESSLEILASSGYRHLYFQQQQQQEAEAEAERRQRWHAAQELSFGGGHGYDYGDAGGGAVMVEAGQVTLDPRVSTAGGGGGGGNSSASGAAAGQPGNAVYQRSRLWEQQRQRRLERDRHEAERREREICSFRPKVSAASAQLAAKGDIATRHQRWQQERDARLQSERQRQSVDEVKDCTFVPRVPVPPKSVAQKVAATRVPLVAPTSPSRSVESSSGHSGGLSGHGSNHSQGHVSQLSQLSQPHFGFEDFATPYTAFLPKSPTAAGHKAAVAAFSSSSTQSQSQSQSSVSAAASAAGGVRFRTKSASELLAIKAQANLASHAEDAQRDAEHGVYSAPPTATHRSSQGQGQGQPPASAASQFSFAEFPPSQLRYGASHHPPVAPPASAPLTAAQQHWQQYYPQNAQLRELDDDDGHGAVDYAADMTSLEQLAQLSLRQERQQFQQQQQHHHQHQQQQQQQPVSYGYNPRSHQQRPPPHMMYHHHEHDDAHSAAFDPEDML